MNWIKRSLVPSEPFHSEQVAPGVTLRRLYPGGMKGPNNEVSNDVAGGQTWSELVMLGKQGSESIYAIPDIRLPPNQLWPLHWHDCWTVVVVLEGKCLIGDWTMQTGDVFVAEPSVEYGPLVIGPMGCRLLEIFQDLALSPGGYAPEYRDHPTLRGGDHVFKQREGINLRNGNHSSLMVEGTQGMTRSKLAPGRQWDLGDPHDPDHAVIRDTRPAAGRRLAAPQNGDWYGALIMDGSIDIGGRTLIRDDVIVAERGASMPDMTAGPRGAHVLENFRTTRSLPLETCRAI
jgi:hypothetical protein